VVENAKVQRPSVCNALDVLLLDAQIAATTLPSIVQQLARAGVQFRLCMPAFAIAKTALEIADPASFATVALAGPEDFDTEWLSLTLSIRLVNDSSEAIAHIQQHSSGHSDGVLAEDPKIWPEFMQQIDSAAIYHNASTRFTDGSELGLGAEIAVSTERLHARGPMGLNELMSSKWIVQGQYHIRT
jgi:glutamate-5-semialdehyde dehydrogenase